MRDEGAGTNRDQRNFILQEILMDEYTKITTFVMIAVATLTFLLLTRISRRTSN